MIVTTNIPQTREALSGGKRTALVPTMGALHAGHVSLIHRAKQLADRVAVSIFVNPTQFGPNEDFDRYPRPIEKDLQLCREAGADLVFSPTPDVIYPADELELSIDVPALTNVLEGAHRPGHFVGVCRVVAKLLNIIRPDVACFGMKDFQQLAVIQAMVRGLAMPVEIEPCPTVREPNGLAMSSRNVYLTPEQRPAALSLSKALREAHRLVAEGECDPKVIERAMEQEMAAHRVLVNYAVVRNARTLQPLDIINPKLAPVVCLLAGRVGSVRLIDNAVLGA